ncbi:uncharacterized protein [Diadema setosum]|uniref:uncharacterized protein n=1 Tax=Diadema setosum TaxID=31175 RepID=UPI003B3AD342
MEPLDNSALLTYLPSLPIRTIQPWEVFNELKKIKTKKASGPGDIPSGFISLFALELSQPLTDVINASFAQATVPMPWKQANVTPVPKSSPTTIHNLRPVALTDHFAKIAVHFIAKDVLRAMISRLDPAQYGNLKGASTSHYLVDVMHMLHSHTDKPATASTIYS